MVVPLFDGGHEAQADGILVGVQEATAHAAMGAITHEQHGRALALGRKETVLDGTGRQLEELLDAHSHFVALGTRDAEGPLGQKRVHTLGQNHDLGGDLIVSGLDADDRARLVLYQLFHTNASDDLATRLLAQLSHPGIEGGTQDAVAVVGLLAQLLAGKVDGRIACRVHEGNALMGNLALEGNLVPHDIAVGILVENLAQRMSVDAATGHVLRPGRLTTLDDEHAFAFLCRDVGRNGACAPAAHDDDIEIALFHAAPP